MNTCKVCGYKSVSNKFFERHMASHPEVNEEIEVAKTESVEPVEVEEVSSDIELHFTKDVEIKINGIPYFGRDIKVKDMAVASEIVRIAREAYGPLILN